MKFGIDLSTQNLVDAYSQGIFPMGDEFGHINWYEADPRGIVPLESFHVPHDLKRILRQKRFDVTMNEDFHGVISACREERNSTWITDEIIEAYLKLHKKGFAYSVESWQNGELVGGLYGVAVGGAFFGESMFYRRRDASKVALAHLGKWLIAADFQLFDIQMMTDLLRRFGAILISKKNYLNKLERAIQVKRHLQPVAIQW
jgi:leucyl/phenylalanyl-tRNA--protein transferase